MAEIPPERHAMPPADFRAWKKRRRLNDQEIAELLGLSVSSVNRKLRGKQLITKKLPCALANIDKLIARFELPDGCSEKTARLILSGAIR